MARSLNHVNRDETMTREPKERLEWVLCCCDRPALYRLREQTVGSKHYELLA